MAARIPRPALLRRLGVEVTRLDPGSALITPPGRRLSVDRVDADTWLVRRQRGRRWRGKEQQTLHDHLRHVHVTQLLRKLGITCVLDGGANRGQFARSLRRAGYAGRIVSFEPVPALAERLRRKTARDPDWRVIECALGETEEKAELNVRPGAMSSLLPSSDFGKGWSTRLQETETHTISVRRLDGLFDEAIAGLADPRVYLKLDTQGYDLPAFTGAGDRLADIVGMQSEVACVPIYDGMPRLTDQIAAYEAAGFEITGMFPVTQHRPTLRVIEFDVMMVRADAVGQASGSQASGARSL